MSTSPVQGLLVTVTDGSRLSLFKFINLLYVSEYFACMHVYAPPVYSALRSQKRVLELELQMAVSCHTGDGN